MNLAMGAKIIWRLISNTKEWWRMEVFCKYFNKIWFPRVEIRNGLDQAPKYGNYEKKKTPLIVDYLNW